MPQRYKLAIEYDGTGLNGWQVQADAPTVQGTIQSAIKDFCQHEVTAVTSGRTDAGVHAVNQVIHIDLPETYPEFKVRDGLNFHLRQAGARIVILSAEAVANDFHARFSAKRRHYMYRMINRYSPLALDYTRACFVRETLDATAMHEAAQYLVGEHDFSSFRAAACQANSPFKTIEKASVEKIDEQEIRFLFTANSFLHHQVRNMVGTLRLVGCGKWQPIDVKHALEARDRKASGPTASARGLYFVGVDYH